MGVPAETAPSKPRRRSSGPEAAEEPALPEDVQKDRVLGRSKATQQDDLRASCAKGRAVMAKTTRRTTKPVAIEVSSGNVFEDLGLPRAGERLAKAKLARSILHIIQGKRWTQRRAAEVLAIAPPDVSDLMRGKLARFSQERLERFLNALDMDVQIRVRPRAAGKAQADVTVEFVAV
jgi:predicted XRE-type DNA-binding protein